MDKQFTRFEQLTDAEIARLLNVSEEQARALRDFIRQVGGMQYAEKAVNMLGRISKAA